MSKPGDIPQDLWDLATYAVHAPPPVGKTINIVGSPYVIENVARAIMAAKAEERFEILQLIKQEISSQDEINALYQAIRSRS